MKAIIVDDESAARRVLEALITRNCSDVDIIDRCPDVMSAVQSIKKNKPDVVFLDVEMPNFAGYEIVNFFDEVTFKIIFTTAYDQYAIKAFSLSAVDYLLKPINRQRLVEAVDRVKIDLSKNDQIENYKVLLDSIKEKQFQKLILPELGNKRIIDINEVIAIEGHGAYSKLFLSNDRKIMVSKNLGHFEKLLSDHLQFFRCHKSWIIDLERLESYNKTEGKIQLKDGLEVKLSKYKIAEFTQVLQEY